MSLAVGVLVLMGFLLSLAGIVVKFTGLNLLAPLCQSALTYILVANAFFILALLIDRFE